MDTSTEPRGEHEGHEGHEDGMPVQNDFAATFTLEYCLRTIGQYHGTWIILCSAKAIVAGFDFLLLRALRVLRVDPGVWQ